ncbi:hypothetical protein B0J14DRAFT_648473 [Halenospora varia]|nr:hypothetical protein B0J14DRAFT_648473 [Halenospora varia]
MSTSASPLQERQQKNTQEAFSIAATVKYFELTTGIQIQVVDSINSELNPKVCTFYHQAHSLPARDVANCQVFGFSGDYTVYGKDQGVLVHYIPLLGLETPFFLEKQKCEPLEDTEEAATECTYELGTSPKRPW